MGKIIKPSCYPVWQTMLEGNPGLCGSVWEGEPRPGRVLVSGKASWVVKERVWNGIVEGIEYANMEEWREPGTLQELQWGQGYGDDLKVFHMGNYTTRGSFVRLRFFHMLTSPSRVVYFLCRSLLMMLPIRMTSLLSGERKNLSHFSSLAPPTISSRKAALIISVHGELLQFWTGIVLKNTNFRIYSIIFKFFGVLNFHSQVICEFGNGREPFVTLTSLHVEHGEHAQSLLRLDK